MSLSKQVAQLGELGLMGVAISEENGGTGLDYLVRQDTLSEVERMLIRESRFSICDAKSLASAPFVGRLNKSETTAWC